MADILCKICKKTCFTIRDGRTRKGAVAYCGECDNHLKQNLENLGHLETMAQAQKGFLSAKNWVTKTLSGKSDSEDNWL